jgi:hypothetical protein
MITTRRRGLPHLAFLLFLAISSTPSCQMTCTLVGCESGLTVRFTGNVPVGARVTVSSPGQQPATADCPPNLPCPGVFFPRVTWTRVSITIQTSTTTISKDLTLTYHDFKPNGSGCGPTCSVSEVEIAL